jgi:hypothetical protein
MVFLRLRRQVLHMWRCATVRGPSGIVLCQHDSRNVTSQWFSQWLTEAAAALREIAERRIKSNVKISAAIQIVATLGYRLVSF